MVIDEEEDVLGVWLVQHLGAEHAELNLLAVMDRRVDVAQIRLGRAPQLHLGTPSELAQPREVRRHSTTWEE